MNVLVTGATGFIGKQLCVALSREGHNVVAMMRSPDAIESLKAFVSERGGKPEGLSALKGDLEQPNLGLTSAPEQMDAIVHLAGRFSWHLPENEARATNVTGSVKVAELAQRLQCRLVFISGFMMANEEHLARSGIHPTDPAKTDWPKVYRKLGGYEASKLESALVVREFVQQHQLDAVEVQPSTVSGHSITGEITADQPLYQLMDNLFRGRMTAIPGTPEHWLPLIPVEVLAELITQACTAQEPPKKLLALNDTTPNLQGLLTILARAADKKAPRQHVPMSLLRGLLKIPGLATLLNVAPESLDFIQTKRFDTTVTRQFMAETGIAMPDIEQSLRASAHYYQQLASAKPTPEPV